MQTDIPKLFRSLTHGVYVIGVNGSEQPNAFTAAWVVQVSFDPLLLGLSINPLHSSYRMLKSSKAFSVNVLADNQFSLAENFGKPASEDKLKNINWTKKTTNAPILMDALSFFECELSHEIPAGDHVFVIGKVVNGGVLNSKGKPMNYRDAAEIDGSSALYPNSF